MKSSKCKRNFGLMGFMSLIAACGGSDDSASSSGASSLPTEAQNLGLTAGDIQNVTFPDSSKLVTTTADFVVSVIAQDDTQQTITLGKGNFFDYDYQKKI